MIKTYVDKKNKFKEIFNTKNGTYIRTGVLDENGKDTGIDPFMRDFPALIDIGVMGHCIHGASGLCLGCCGGFLRYIFGYPRHAAAGRQRGILHLCLL